MHAVLQTPELKALILELSLDNRSLSSLARTCKAFEEPALSVLWRSVSMREIMRLLPDSERHYEMDEGNPVNCDLTTQEASRIHFYGKFVRSLDLFDTHLYCSCIFLDALVRALPGNTILPFLRTLHYDSSSGYRFLPILISHSVREITILLCEDYPDEAGLDSLVYHFIDGTKQLDWLDLTFSFSRNRNSQFYPLLSHWADMGSLKIELSHLDSATALVIGSLPKLKQLSIIVWWYEPAPDLRCSTRVPDNLTLDALELAMEVGPAEADAYAGVDVLVDIVALLRPVALSAVVVRDLFDSDRFRHCCKGIKAYCAVDVLRVIDLTMSHESVPTRLEDIRPLLAFYALESLSLAHCLFHPTAGDIADMGRSWPRLRVLRLSDPRSETEHYQHFLPFELLLFAQHFPLLGELHARLDMTGVKAIDSSPLPARAWIAVQIVC